jgi:hypothetical protein
MLALAMACVTMIMFIDCAATSGASSHEQHEHGTSSALPQDHDAPALSHLHCPAGVLPLVVFLPLLSFCIFSLSALAPHTSIRAFPPLIPPRHICFVSLVTA